MAVVIEKTALRTALDTYLAAQMEANHLPGLSVAVVQEGTPVVTAGYGLANVEQATPACAATVYELASITKQFTATAIMLLIQEGKLALDDRLLALRPDLPASWGEVTVWHLLTHTSGIPSYTSLPEMDKFASVDLAPAELLVHLTDLPLDFPTGQQYAYNNTGYFLLGLLVEQLSGSTFDAFLQARIFAPLGMATTRLNNRRLIIPGRAGGYGWSEEVGLYNAMPCSPTISAGSGGLLSTVDDLARWDAALYGDALLPQAVLARMWAPAMPIPDSDAHYGFGWAISDHNGHRMVGHAGGMPGFSTMISRYLDDRLTVIVLCNSHGGCAPTLARGIAALIMPEVAEVEAAQA